MTESTTPGGDDALAPEKTDDGIASTKAATGKKPTPLPLVMLRLGIFGFGCVYILLICALHSSLLSQIVLIPFPAKEHEFTEGAVAGGVKATEEYFKASDGSTLHGWYFKTPGAKRTVVFHHGNAGNIAYRIAAADGLVKGGTSVFVYDYRGYGKSTGKSIIATIVPDGLAAWEHVTKKLGVDPQTLVNYGESIGTGVACQVAQQRPSAGLILQSPIGSLPLMGHKHFNFVQCIPLLAAVPDFLFPDPKLDNIEAVKNIHVPLLIVHGKLDTTAPFEHAELIYASANEPKKLVPLPNGHHNDVGHDEKLFTDSISAFLQAPQTTASAAKSSSPSNPTQHQ